MKIAIIAGAFKPGWGYLDNMMAELLPPKGHDVRVFAAGAREADARFVSTGDGHGYELKVVFSRRLPRAVWFSFRDLARAIPRYAPDVVFWVGPTRYFGRALVSEPRLMRFPVVSFFSECAGWHGFDWKDAGTPLKDRVLALAYRHLRGPMVRAACRRSQLIVGVTPQTRQILLALFPPGDERRRIEAKTIVLPLGYQPKVTRWDPALRAQLRRELGFAPRDVVVAVSSRFAPNKAGLLESLVRGLTGAMARNADIRGLLIGLDAGATSEQIRRQIRDGEFPDRFVCQDFADQVRMNALFNASDVALFGNCSNSCQSALGTGAFACFADNGTMDHLLTSPEQGVLFRPGDADDLSAQLLAAAAVTRQRCGREYPSSRQRLASASEWLSYDRIIESVMDRARSLQRAGSRYPPAPRPRTGAPRDHCAAVR